jgi:NitT/TauT family transport system substrate-binding protein
VNFSSSSAFPGLDRASHSRTGARRALAFLLPIVLLVAACSSSAATGAPTAASSTAAASSAAASSAATPIAPASGSVLRLGYFPNVTHATAIVGVEGGLFQQALGSAVTLQTSTFNDGTSASQALLSGAIDATYIGPNPAINAFQKSNGSAVRVVSGATSGGAFLVVKQGINAASDLKGKKVASPGLGNTQDISLRTWLLNNGLKTDTQGGGDVSIVPEGNSQTLQSFISGSIDGAWVPEPWATQLIEKGNGHILVKESDLWPQGQYATTVLLVRTDYLTAHPDVIKALLQGELQANDLIASDPAKAQSLVTANIDRVTGTTLDPAVTAAAWKNLTFTEDPIASSFKTSAENAVKLGLLKTVDLTNLFDLSILNGLLKDAGKPTVNGL